MDEKTLVARCLAGGPSGDTPDAASPWEAFVDGYGAALEGAVRGTLKTFGVVDESMVQDLVQEAFVSLLDKDGSALRRFDWKIPLRLYLCRIAIHRAVDHLRRTGKILPLIVPEAELLLLADLGGAPAVETEEFRRQVRDALACLTPRERIAVTLFYWEKLSPERIGTLLGWQTDSVRSLLAKARARLKDRLHSLF